MKKPISKDIYGEQFTNKKLFAIYSYTTTCLIICLTCSLTYTLDISKNIVKISKKSWFYTWNTFVIETCCKFSFSAVPDRLFLKSHSICWHQENMSANLVSCFWIIKGIFLFFWNEIFTYSLLSLSAEIDKITTKPYKNHENPHKLLFFWKLLLLLWWLYSIEIFQECT